MSRTAVFLSCTLALLAVGCSDGASSVAPVEGIQDSLPRLIRSCGLASVCQGRSLSSCLGIVNSDDAATFEAVPTWQKLAKQWPCLQTATDCISYWKCIHSTAMEPCNLSPNTQKCQGDTLVECASDVSKKSYLVYTDCAVTGGTCVPSGQQARCGLKVCTGSSGSWCQGNTLVWCISHKSTVAITFDCGASGQVCRGERCADPSGACTQSACDGSKVRRCARDGKSQTTGDCHWVSKDFVCYKDGSQFRCGLPSDKHTCKRTDEATCEGSKAKICIGGRIQTIDCASFFGATCKDNGVNGVSCVRPSGS